MDPLQYSPPPPWSLRWSPSDCPTPMVIFIGKYSVEIAQFFIIVFSLQLVIIVMSIIYLGTCIFSQTAQLFT